LFLEQFVSEPGWYFAGFDRETMSHICRSATTA